MCLSGLPPLVLWNDLRLQTEGKRPHFIANLSFFYSYAGRLQGSRLPLLHVRKLTEPEIIASC